MKFNQKYSQTNFSSDYYSFIPDRIHFYWLYDIKHYFKSNKNHKQKSLISVSNLSKKSSLYSKISFPLTKDNSNHAFDHNRHQQDLIQMLNQSNNESEALLVLENMWKENFLCDLILVSYGREFLAHRLALAIFSDKYKTYFENKCKHEFVTRLQLIDSHPRAVLSLLSFVYTNQINLSLKTIEDVLTCARELDLKKLTKLCESFLLGLDKRNSLQVLQISRKFKLKVPYFRSFWYVCSNFNDSIKQNYFIKLCPGLLSELFSNNTTLNRNETFLFKRLLMWVYFNKDKYEHNKIADLLKQINMSKIKLDDLDLIINENSFILNIPECLNLLKNAIKLHFDLNEKNLIKLRSRSAVPGGFKKHETFNYEKEILETKKPKKKSSNLKNIYHICELRSKKN